MNCLRSQSRILYIRVLKSIAYGDHKPLLLAAMRQHRLLRAAGAEDFASSDRWSRWPVGEGRSTVDEEQIVALLNTSISISLESAESDLVVGKISSRKRENLKIASTPGGDQADMPESRAS